MRIAIVNPPRYKGIPVIREDRCEITEKSSVLPPYSLLQIASFLRERGHTCMFLDANEKDISLEDCRNWLRNSRCDVVLFRFTPTTFISDMTVADISKELSPSTLTIGICHTLSRVAPEVMTHAPNLDIFVTGDSYEEILDRLLSNQTEYEDFSAVPEITYRTLSGKVVTSEHSDRLKSDLDRLPLPAYDYISGGRYRHKSSPDAPYMIMTTARGCPFSCSFCTVRKSDVRMKSSSKVMEEIDHVVRRHGVRRLGFFDETFTIDRRRIVDICSGLAEKNYPLKWYCNTRVDCVDEDLLSMMAQAGCDGISYGVESGSQQILDSARKGITVDQARDAIIWTKDVGVKAYASFVLGLPGENSRTLAETRDFVRRVRPTGAQFNLAVPYPGTALHEIALSNGWIDSAYSWLELYQHSAHMRTAELTQTCLDNARINMYKSLFLNPWWLTTNVLHVLMNPSDIRMGLSYYADGLRGLLNDRMRHRH